MRERNSLSLLFAVLATLGCWAAGVYLLQTEPADPDTILAVIMDGMGIYFVAKGFFVGPMLWKQIDEVESLRALREYAAAEGEARRVRES